MDINLAPLENTIFNEAKSENKWMEAALVKTVTVASDVGAFHDCVEHKVTGILCKDAGEWEAELRRSGRRSGISEEDIGKCLFKMQRKLCNIQNGITSGKIV